MPATDIKHAGKALPKYGRGASPSVRACSKRADDPNAAYRLLRSHLDVRLFRDLLSTYRDAFGSPFPRDDDKSEKERAVVSRQEEDDTISEVEISALPNNGIRPSSFVENFAVGRCLSRWSVFI